MPTILASNQNGLGIATDGKNVYWITASDSNNDPSSGTVNQIAAIDGACATGPPLCFGL